MIKLIWARTTNNLIGNAGKLPWRIKEELNHFKQETLNKNIVMGRKTWDSLPVKPLENRKSYILTRGELSINYDDVFVINNINDILQSDDEFYVIGGKEIYTMFYPYASHIIDTKIHEEYTGDIFLNMAVEEDFKLTKTKTHKEFTVSYWER